MSNIVITSGVAVSPTRRECLDRNELDLARRIHEALIPEACSGPRMDLSVLFRPRDWLGGDYCQAVMVDGHTVYLTICDVTGHGVGSAMLASRVSMIVRGVLEYRPSPKAILERVDAFHRKFYTNEFELLPLSFLACVLDLDTRILKYASAGHPGPLVVRHEPQSYEHHPSQNLLIGVEKSCLLDPFENVIALDPGDRVALFSDGVTDALSPDANVVGVEGLARLLLENTTADVFALRDLILDEIQDGDAESYRDDQTMFLLELR